MIRYTSSSCDEHDHRTPTRPGVAALLFPGACHVVAQLHESGLIATGAPAGRMRTLRHGELQLGGGFFELSRLEKLSDEKVLGIARAVVKGRNGVRASCTRASALS